MIPEYLTVQQYVNWLQRFIILHSHIYYDLNWNAISDKDYDKKSKELVELKRSYPDLWKSSEYYNQFGDDYNGSTGFDLYDGLSKRQKRIIDSLVICGLCR